MVARFFLANWLLKGFFAMGPPKGLVERSFARLACCEEWGSAELSVIAISAADWPLLVEVDWLRDMGFFWPGLPGCTEWWTLFFFTVLVVCSALQAVS